uniref:PRELI/MSF1 domain-containing protein n=1 Tax=Acrobeloides nanus TaxID=290746 RepID=A0A914DEY3_9BILA
MKYWTQERVFDHPWNIVANAAYRKYPNPVNENITGIDVLQQDLKNGVLQSERLLQSHFSIPGWASKLTGFSGTQYSYELSKIDPINRSMHLFTRNLNIVSMLRVDEKLVYEQHPTDPNKTLLKQEAIVEVNLPALTDYCEKTFMSTYQKNAEKGPRGLEWVIEQLKREYNDLSSKVSHEFYDLTNVTGLHFPIKERETIFS